MIGRVVCRAVIHHACTRVGVKWCFHFTTVGSNAAGATTDSLITHISTVSHVWDTRDVSTGCHC